MRSSRLLSVLLLLQARGRVTTTELAERLEVSRRTVLRDVEALSAAGVPVYAERGRHGGIVLDRGSRLNVSHLDGHELDLLLVPGLDESALARLGLAESAALVERKLAARVPAPELAPPLRDLVVVEGTSWTGEEDVDVAALVEVVSGRRRLRVSYRRSGEPEPRPLVVDPYGVGRKGGRWYLVADVSGEPRLLALSRLGDVVALDEPAVLRPGESLGTVWRGLVEQMTVGRDVVVEAELRASRVDLARRILGDRLLDVAPAGEGWVRVAVAYEQVEDVRQLLQFGDHIRVVAPDEARERVRQLAGALLAAHSGEGDVSPGARPPGAEVDEDG